MTDCIFCKIVNREIPKEILYEDSEIMAFADIHPKAPVHLLAIPKAHIESIAHLKEEHKEVAIHLLLATKKIAEDQKLAGYKLLFNVGREGGQTIDHLHLHILGGWSSKEEKLEI